MKKRLISLLLAFSMMLTFLPAGAVSAFAEENIGDIIADGATIEQGGTYRLSGEYTKRITINTSDPVTINITEGATVKNNGSDLFLEVKEGGKLTLNNKGTYEGNDFLYFKGDKAEISGGKYIITSGTAFTFVDGNSIVVDGIEIQGKTNTDGIKVGELRGIYANKTPNVKIKNSTINVNGDLYGAIYVEGDKAEATLDNVTAHAISRPTIIDYAGKLTINSGRYTNDNRIDVVVSNIASASKVDVIINGGEFEGGSNVKPTLDVSTQRGYQEVTLEIHGGTFTSTQSGLVLRNNATVKIDSSISKPKFYSKSGSLDAIVNCETNDGVWGNGNLQFDDGIIEVLGASKRAALYTCGGGSYVRTVVNGGKIHGAGYGIQVGDGSPVVVLKDVEFENNDTDIYLNANQKISIEKTFKNNATVGCADPKDGRQLTTSTIGKHQKDLNLTSADEDYLVGYKTEGGMEYRCFSKKVGVTISGLKGEIKAEDTAEFTVTLTYKDSTGTGILTFGDKNSEIEYKDEESGEYKPMQKDGLPINLASDKNDYAFRITPKETGKQTLTAAVVRDDVELGTADKDFTVAGRVHTTVAIEGLENAVIKEGESKDFTVKVDPKDDAKLGEAFIDFGDKNSEIEYKDEHGEYKPMPEGGLKIGLGDGEVKREFRITPKDAGEQKLTAAVVRDAVELGTADKNFTVADRVHTAVTIEGLENAVVKEGESKDFTVKVDPKDDAKLGKAVIDFGDKNSEIEYKDEESGEYKPMPEGGLPIDLGDVKEQYAFRITPKETGKQTLTAAVKQGENKLATDEKDFVVSEMPILTLKDGVITSVTVPGKNGADPEDITEIVKKNANEDGSFHVPEGATVSVAFDKDAFADSGLKFGHWDITGLDDPNAYQDKESFAFEMPAKGVTLKAMTQDASIEDDEPDIVGPIVIGTTVVVGGAVLGYQAYSLGAEFAGKLMALPYFPSNRSALAMMLWEDAGKPMPESELLYPDVGQEERDMDLQHAARWAMENELIPDLNDEGTAPEEMKFYPDNAVSKIDVLNAWQKAQELKQNA